MESAHDPIAQGVVLERYIFFAAQDIYDPAMSAFGRMVWPR